MPLLNDLGWMKKKQYKMLKLITKYPLAVDIAGWTAKVQCMCGKLYLNEVL